MLRVVYVPAIVVLCNLFLFLSIDFLKYITPDHSIAIELYVQYLALVRKIKDCTDFNNLPIYSHII